MTAETKTNYTETMVAQLVAGYRAGETVEQLAQTLGKSVRSVVAKLSREGVYVAKPRQTAARVTKAELVARIATAVGAQAEVLESLEKATHEALETLAARLGA